ncbi:MAG: hypothetical protein ABSF45_24770 [Terriglobia bacterium]|jgi:hypothetical protein
MLVALAAGSAAVLTAAQTLDRVVASIGNSAITASDVEQEYRLERFLDAQWPPPPPDSATLTGARERLTYQLLLTVEENPGPADRAESEKSAAERLAALRKEFAHPEDFQRALKDLGMSETELVARMAQQELMLRLIDQRLRPAASPSDKEIADYYGSTFVPEFQKKNGGAAAPPLSAVEGQIREVLTQKHMNELLDQWIGDLKPTTNVRFHTF